MTPRTKDLNLEPDLTWFSDVLFSRLEQKSFTFDLTGEGAILKIRHPALIKAQYQFERTSDVLARRQQSTGWNILVYRNLNDAQRHHPESKRYGGFPFEIFQFLEANPSEALVNFEGIGTAFLTKQNLPWAISDKVDLHDILIPIWLDYALSPELWGPAGKWTRFHLRLHTLFTKYGLLISNDFPGYYSLKTQASWLENFGFMGKLNKTSFDLTLPWDFPFTGLIELEKVLARGP